MIKIRGNSTEEKINAIERILNRFQRKLHNTVIGVMPPVPIMFSVKKVDSDGEIFSFLIPAKGVITSICLYIKEFNNEKETVRFKASIEGPAGGTYATIETRKNLTIGNLNLNVSAGDLLVLTTPTPDAISGVWLAFLYQMGIKDCGQEKFLAEELERLLIREGEDSALYPENPGA